MSAILWAPVRMLRQNHFSFVRFYDQEHSENHVGRDSADRFAIRILLIPA